MKLDIRVNNNLKVLYFHFCLVIKLNAPHITNSIPQMEKIC